jgi:pyruvate kinase
MKEYQKPAKTKILCTIGPASSSLENLIKLINEGMDAARLNFSHGSYEEHLNVINNIRKAEEITDNPIAILQDLQGPKIRTGKVENGSVELKDGEPFIITSNEMEYGTNQMVSTVYKNLPNDVKPGNTLLLDDGYLILKIEKIENGDIYTKIIKGGILKDHKGIIAPGASISAPPLSDKDLEDLKFGLNAGVDAVALSFVRSPKDIVELKAAMKIYGRTVPIIAKIERMEAIAELDSIIEESDGIMVARGDLGLEFPAEQVPIIQKDIIRKCNYHGKFVITATQILESMIINPRPTRAEASDVANAVIDGSDCLMLSGETSVGKYPFEAVGYMDRIIRLVEDKFKLSSDQYETPISQDNQINDALSKASVMIAGQINASAIIPLTRSGYTAKFISKYRPGTPIVALTDSKDVQRGLSFIWGVQAILIPKNEPLENIFQEIGNYLKDQNYINEGDYVVFIGRLSYSKLIPQNMIKVYQV